MDDIFNKIIEKIDKGEEISPFLFISKNTEILNENIKNLALKILKHYEIPKEYFYVFVKEKETKSEKIWVEEIRNFSSKADIWTPFKVQIFLIENLWNLTDSAWNSLLKFFEEPWVQNIVFTTNSSEVGILDTILSRVQIINFESKSKDKTNSFYQDLLKNYLKNNDTEIINYFFNAKIEKEEYISFLENLIIFIKNNLIFIEFLDEILEDINAIKQNNVNAKFITDKWIFKINQ